MRFTATNKNKIAAKFLADAFVNRAEIESVIAERAKTPPKETIGKAGESTWLKAIRVQPKPPNGTRALNSSMSRKVSALSQMLCVLLKIHPIGR